MDLVPELELRNALSNRLSEWNVRDKHLERTFHFPSFRFAKEFVDRVSEIAEEMNHHPDISLRYDKVTISLISHDADGLTYRDTTFAGKVQEIAPELTNPSRSKSA